MSFPCYIHYRCTLQPDPKSDCWQQRREAQHIDMNLAWHVRHYTATPIQNPKELRSARESREFSKPKMVNIPCGSNGCRGLRFDTLPLYVTRPHVLLDKTVKLDLAVVEEMDLLALASEAIVPLRKTTHTDSREPWGNRAGSICSTSLFWCWSDLPNRFLNPFLYSGRQNTTCCDIRLALQRSLCQYSLCIIRIPESHLRLIYLHLLSFTYNSSPFCIAALRASMAMIGKPLQHLN